MNFYTNVQLLGDTVLHRGYGASGERLEYRTHFSPTLFLTTPKESKFRTLDGKYAKPIKFDSPRDAREFAAKYEQVENVQVCGYERFIYQYIAKEFPGEIDWDMSVMNIWAIDIEVACENGFPNVDESAEEILCITMKNLMTKKWVCWATREFTPPTDIDIQHKIFWTEHEMLEDFITWWTQNTPDVITGWNCNLYDIPYICRRVSRVLGDKWMKSLSPWNRVNEREVVIMGRKNIAYDVLGVSILDYLDLYKKFTYTNQ